MYIEGDEKVIRGVKCNCVRVPFGHKNKYLALGYKMSLEDLYQPVKRGRKKVSKDG